MNQLLKLGNAILGLSLIVMLSNSIDFFFTNIFYEKVSIYHKLVMIIILIIFILIFLWNGIKKDKEEQKDKKFFSFKIFIFCVMIIWQILLLVSMPIVPIADPYAIFQIAKGEFGNGLSNYISINPNNYTLLLWEKLLIIIFSEKYLLHGFILFNIIFLDSALVLLYKISKNIYPHASSALYYLSIIFIGFSPQFLPLYTDILAFFLGTLIMYIGYQLFNSRSMFEQVGLSLLLGGILAISYGMRAPLLIYAIAGIIVLVYQLSRNKLHIKWKNMILILSAVSTFGIVHLASQYSLRQEYFAPYESEKSRTLLYFIDLGLTSSGAAHAELTEEVINASGPERNKIFLNSIKNRISRMSFSDWREHISTKYYNISAEGMLGWQTENILREENVVSNRWTSNSLMIFLRRTILVNFTDYYRISLFFQLIWISIILGMVLYTFCFSLKEHPISLWAQITIFGGLLFLMIFEGGRSRYLIQFLPAILWISALGYTNIIKKVKEYVR